MTSEASIHKLVKVAISKKLSLKFFANLLKQLLQNVSVSDNELQESLLEIPRLNEADYVKLRVEYGLELAQISPSDLEKFFNSLPKLTFHSQRAYLIHLKNNYTQIFKLGDLKEFVNVALVNYTSALAAKLQESASLDTLQTSVWTHTLFLWGDIIDKHADVILTGKFKEMAVSVMKTLAKFENFGLSTYFTRKANTLTNISDLSKEIHAAIPEVPHKTEKVTSQLVKKTHSVNFHSKKGANYLKIKKFAWLNIHFQNWDISSLVDRFVRYFSVPTHKGSEFLVELIDVFFSGFKIAVELGEKPYVIFNWKNFIVCQLPIFLKESKHLHNLENFGDILATAVKKYDDTIFSQCHVGGYKSSSYDLRKQFLKSCIYKNLVSLDTFTKTFPEEADSLSPSLITHEIEQLNHTDSLAAEMDSKLLDVNTEFTSLEESKLIDFFSALPTSNLVYLDRKQKHLSKLVHSVIDTLTKQKSNEKLARLMIAMGNNLALANFVMFNDAKGPWGMLNQLISYTDKESFGVDDDDSNFQDTYGYFGTILCGIITLSSFFGVDFEVVAIQDSYTVDFINRFYFRHCEDLTLDVKCDNEDDSTIVANYNTLLQDWVNALFDVNNDGLSDDLIKSINVKQTYKLISVIFQQAITANIVGSLSTSGLHNGVDYLSQNFLAPCSLEIMQWISSRIGPLYTNSEGMVSVLVKIMDINIGAEPNYLFRMILQNLGGQLISKLKLLKNFERSEAARAVDYLHREIDAEYTQTAAAYTPDLCSFSLAETMKLEVMRGVRDTTYPLDKTWKVTRKLWEKLGDNLAKPILSEIGKCSGTHVNYADSEEAKIFLDFLTFLTVSTSGTLAQIADPADKTPQSKFELLIDNHFSSIFSEISGSMDAEKPAKQELAPDFEVEDLFNDVGDDLFGDTVLHALGRKPYTPPPEIATTYQNLRGVFSRYEILKRQLQARASDPSHKTALLKLAHDYENWTTP